VSNDIFIGFFGIAAGAAINDHHPRRHDLHLRSRKASDHTVFCVSNDNLHRQHRHRCWRCSSDHHQRRHDLHLRSRRAGDHIACCVSNDNLIVGFVGIAAGAPISDHHLRRYDLHLRSRKASDHIACCVFNDIFIVVVGIAAGAASVITNIYDDTTCTCDLCELVPFNDILHL
jgi:hypothetical protein